ncbi:MAG: alpha/beta hydrolase [Bauldia litoralis]
MTASRATAPDGCGLAYSILTDAGPEAPRLALVHSLAMDRHFWDGVADSLSDSASILALDCRGHGESDKPAGPYSAERFGDDLAAVLDAAGWKDAVVAGSSMGGCVALAFAARHPGRTRGLGLIDTTAWYGDDAPDAWAGRATKAQSGGMAALIDFQVSRWFSDAFRESRRDVVEAAISTFLRNDVEAYAATCHMLGACDLRATLPGIAAPTRVIVGEEDYATPVAMATVLRDGIPGAEMTVLGGVRHFTPLECPDRIAAELTTLIEASQA